MIQETLASFEGVAQDKGLQLTADVEPHLPKVFCDRDRILQVLSNLVGNATKATPEGGHITLRVESRGHELLFSISDDGPGIGAEDLEHLFERYWRSDEVEYKGTGLGLAIARGIVTAHGGRIWAESELGAWRDVLLHGSRRRRDAPLHRSRAGRRTLGTRPRRRPPSERSLTSRAPQTTADLDVGHTEALLKAGALQSAIFNSANFSSIATDAKGVIQIFNVGAERMLGLRGRRGDEQDHAGRHLRSAGGDRARQGAERRARNADRAGLRGPGLQGVARDRGHLRADLLPQGREPVPGGGVGHGAARRRRTRSSAIC